MEKLPILLSSFLGLLAGAVILPAGCSRAPEAPRVERRGKEEVSRPLPEYEKELRANVSDIANVFDLNAARREYRRRGGRSKEILALLAQREEALFDAVEPLGKISPEAEILTCDYRKVGENRYRLDLLFKVRSEFDRDYRLYLHRHVEEEHLPLLPPEIRGYGFESWSFEPLPPTSVWDIGALIYISTDFNAHSIPYYLKTGFFRIEEGRYGKEVALGWRADLEYSEGELLERIEETEDLVELYELWRRFQYAGGRAQTASKRLEERIDLFLAEETIACPISPEATLLDFRSRRINADLVRLYYFIDVTEVPKSDYRIYLHGYVDDEHLHYLPEDRRRHKFANWSFAPRPPASTWKPGEKILITAEITAQPIPYDLKTGFFLPGVGRPGIQCDLGRYQLSD